MKKKTEKMLTEVELELMSILWRLGEGSVKQVMEQLTSDRELAYTSVSTMLRILEQKGAVSARKVGRGHSYVPVLKKSEYEERAVKHVVEQVFDSTPLAMVRQLLGTMEMSATEIAELRRMLDKKK